MDAKQQFTVTMAKRRRRRKTEDSYPTWTYKRLGGHFQTKKGGHGYGTVKF